MSCPRSHCWSRLERRQLPGATVTGRHPRPHPRNPTPAALGGTGSHGHCRPASAVSRGSPCVSASGSPSSHEDTCRRMGPSVPTSQRPSQATSTATTGRTRTGLRPRRAGEVPFASALLSSDGGQGGWLTGQSVGPPALEAAWGLPAPGGGRTEVETAVTSGPPAGTPSPGPAPELCARWVARDL